MSTGQSCTFIDVAHEDVDGLAASVSQKFLIELGISCGESGLLNRRRNLTSVSLSWPGIRMRRAFLPGHEIIN